MGKPKNIEWVVSGSAKLRGVTAIVHAVDQSEAVKKANAGDFIGAIEYDGAELVDYDFDLAQHGTDLD